MKGRFVAIAVTGAMAFSAEAAPTMSPVVSAVQDSATGAVTVSYAVNEESIITFDVFVGDVPIGTNRLAFVQGDVNKTVSAGSHEFIWDAMRALADVPGTKTLTFKVTAWDKTTPPDVIVSDLADASLRYYVGLEGLPGGVQDDRYKTTEIVFRRIPGAAGTADGNWLMGVPDNQHKHYQTVADQNNWGCTIQHRVLFTKDWYMGVYPVTQGQYLRMKKGYRTCFYTNAIFRAKRPVDNLAYSDIRGTGWPGSGYSGADGQIKTFRTATGLIVDLPTDAQWEFSCRAGGMDDDYCYGSSLGKNARYKGNDAYPTEGSPNWESYQAGKTDRIACWNYDNGTPEVGSYPANAFGLYDMHGCVWEHCLDWSTKDKAWNTTITYTNPVGAAKATASFAGCTRIMRGGAWNESEADCCAGGRRIQSYTGLTSTEWPGNSNMGFRLVVPEMEPAIISSVASASASVSVTAPVIPVSADGSMTGLDARTHTWMETLVETVNTMASGILMMVR